MIGGFFLGIIAIMYPEVLGSGYLITDASLKGNLPLIFMIGVFIAKFLSSVICLSSGFSGGLFSPLITLGSLIGCIYGSITHIANPELTHEVYAFIGMAALTAAVMGTPISTTFIVFELTSNYHLAAAVLISVVISSVIMNQLVGRKSFFHCDLERKGLDLSSAEEKTILKSILVKEFMAPPEETIKEGMPLQTVRERLQQSMFNELFVINQDNKLVGTVTLKDLQDTAFDHSYDDFTIARDVARKDPPTLKEDNNLEEAIKLMLEVHEGHIPVIDDDEIIIGCVHRNEALQNYIRALVAMHAAERGERKSNIF
jgi:CIC family chloride channel protein